MLRVASDIAVNSINGGRRSLQVCVGDATDTDALGPVDLMVLSCFPNNYWPRPGTLVESLAGRGMNVRDIARDKVRDWRKEWQTWISRPVELGARLGHLVCFEHGTAHDPPSVVGNIFRAVSEFVLESDDGEVGVLRIPLVSSGNQGYDKATMLDAILQQAYTHLRGALPVHTVQVVIHDRGPRLYELLVQAGTKLERVRTEWPASLLSEEPVHDFFISYRRADSRYVDDLLEALRVRDPQARVFRDTESLTRGGHWKPELVTGIYRSRRAICVISDGYPDSIECVDEFHAALCCARHRAGFLLPLLRLSNKPIEALPASFRRINMIEARNPPRSIGDVLEAIVSP